MKKRVFSIFNCCLFFILFSLSSVLFFIFFTPDFYLISGVQDSVTSGKIRSIKLGYNESQVLEILGSPVKRIEHQESNRIDLYYSRPIKFAYTQPKVVVFLENGIVDLIEVQKTVLWGLEKNAFYFVRYSDIVEESDDFDELFGSR